MLKLEKKMQQMEQIVFVIRRDERKENGSERAKKVLFGYT